MNDKSSDPVSVGTPILKGMDMADQHVVTTDQIRFAAAIGMRDTRAHILRPDDEGGATFDAWLAAHDAEVLEAAADEIRVILADPKRKRPLDPAGEFSTDLLNDPQWAEWIVRSRAARIIEEERA